MCTAATYQTRDFYFGRTLDYEFSYGEDVVVTPRRYPFRFRHLDAVKNHYAMVGMAHVADNYPLYYDAVNEKGLCIAGLNFEGNAVYEKETPGKDNVAQFELIPWLLCQCATVQEAKSLLEKLCLLGTRFSSDLPVAQLHWMLADKREAVVIESVPGGLRVHENQVGVLTNNPPFEEQMFNLNNYMSLSADPPSNRFCCKLPLKAYSRGMGALGLPGDLSSQSRFVRAAFVRLHSISGDTEEESVNQFFHILGSVDQPRGSCMVEPGKYEVTLCTTCCNAEKGTYYYTTYENHQISAIDLHRAPLEGSELVRYPMMRTEQIRRQN